MITLGYNRLFESLAPHVGASLGNGITLKTNSQLAPQNRTRAPLCHNFQVGAVSFREGNVGGLGWVFRFMRIASLIDHSDSP